jgi:hypothetical protein
MLRTLQEDHPTQAIGHYIRRARQERELAAGANSAEAEEAHLELARYYETLVSRAETFREEPEGALCLSRVSGKLSSFRNSGATRYSFVGR